MNSKQVSNASKIASAIRTSVKVKVSATTFVVRGR